MNNILTNESVCTLSIETMVCGFQSHVSEAVTAMLKGIIVGHYIAIVMTHCLHYSTKSSSNQRSTSILQFYFK